MSNYAPSIVVALAAAIFAVPLHASPKISVQLGATYSVSDTLWGFGGTPDTGDLGRTFKGTALRVSIGVAYSDRLDFEFGRSGLGSNVRASGFPDGDGLELRDVRRTGHWYGVAWTPRYYKGDWEIIGKLGPARVTRESHAVDDPAHAVRASSTRLLIGFALMRYFSNDIGLRIDVDGMGSVAAARGISVTYRF